MRQMGIPKVCLEFHLFVYRVLFAPLAVFFQRKFFGCVFLVLGGVVVATCALLTSKVYGFSHDFSNVCRGKAQKALPSARLRLGDNLGNNTGTDRTATFTNGEA
jgi:hypothetical protein